MRSFHAIERIAIEAFRIVALFCLVVVDEVDQSLFESENAFVIKSVT